VKKVMLLLALFVVALPVFAQGNAGAGFNFAAGLGTDLLPNPNDPTAMESWSKLALQPEFSIGKFGVGLDLMVRFKLATSGTTAFELYEPDWVPQSGQTIFDVYLPKILYIRYGYQWEDPFYIKMGSISDFTLGNGLIVDNYSNMRFLPQRRIFGMQFGVDGGLFGFPYVGIEALTGNVTKLDVIGGRVYFRPLAFMEKSVLGKLQVGAIGVYDRNPYLYIDDVTYGTSYESAVPLAADRFVYEVGADITLPVIQSNVFSLTTFAEGAREKNKSMGAITGIRGKVLRIVSYGAQFRYFQDGFISSYFDANYDLYRADRFVYIETTSAGTDFNPSWLASLGFDLFKSTLSFRATLDAPFGALPPAPGTDNPAEYPHVLGTLNLARGLIPNVSIAARYEKFFLGKKSGDVFADLIDLEDASIGTTISYKAGAAVVSMDYAYSWNPTKDNFDVVSSLSVGFEL
jgi:hypothetical protein